MSDCESDGEHVSTELVGFMFGNIDNHGNLENDVFDEVSVTMYMFEKELLVVFCNNLFLRITLSCITKLTYWLMFLYRNPRHTSCNLAPWQDWVILSMKLPKNQATSSIKLHQEKVRRMISVYTRATQLVDCGPNVDLFSVESGNYLSQYLRK